MKRSHILFACDQHGCTARLDVPCRAGHWADQPAYEAQNAGWTVTATSDFCPEHNPRLVSVDGERR